MVLTTAVSDSLEDVGHCEAPKPSPFSIETYRVTKSQQAAKKQRSTLVRAKSTMETSRKASRTSRMVSTRDSSTSKASESSEVACETSLNNYFVSRVNRVRRNRVLTAVERAEMDLEKKRVLRSSSTYRSASIPNGCAEKRQYLTTASVKVRQATNSISTQTDDESAKVGSIELERIPWKTSTHQLTWNSNTLFKQYLTSFRRPNVRIK